MVFASTATIELGINATAYLSILVIAGLNLVQSKKSTWKNNLDIQYATTNFTLL